MKFYDRISELKLLKEAVRRRPNLVLIRGRRRVGKTALLLRVLESRKGVYLYVDDKKNEKTLLAEFEETLRHELTLPPYVKIERWGDLYDILFAHGRLLILDEFQRLWALNPSAINQLQDYWDRKGANSKSCLVLSGSNVGMIKKIFLAEGAPLFKRARSDLLLKPFSFSEIREILGDLGITAMEEQIRIYAIAGGIPYYYMLLQSQEVRSWKDAVKALVLNPLSPLKDEVRDTMAESFGKDHPSYYAVINAIALGNTMKKDIATASGIQESSLSPYLYDLENLIDVIEYEVPVTERRSWKSRQGRFVLKDNFFRFWFRYIFRNRSYYEEENYDYLMETISKDFENFVGLAFEQVAREFIAKLNSKDLLPIRFSKTGRWWNRRGDEIDIVLLSEEDNAIMLIECKWDKRVDANEILNSLQQKEWLVPSSKKTVYYGIVARGFKSKTEKAYCWDLQDMGKML